MPLESVVPGSTQPTPMPPTSCEHWDRGLMGTGMDFMLASEDAGFVDGFDFLISDQSSMDSVFENNLRLDGQSARSW